MKQGKIYTKIILGIFLVAVLCYFGYYIFSAIYAPLTTTTAIAYEAGTGSYTTGFVVRQETLVGSDYDITNLVVSEGERVAKGQTVATGYRDNDAQDRQSRIAELERELEQLQYAYSYSSDAADQAALDSEIQSRLLSMSRYVARKDFHSAMELTPALKGLVLRRSSTESDDAALENRIGELQTQLETLRSLSAGDTMTVIAEHSGYFSGTVDGFERVLTTDRLHKLTVETLSGLKAGEVPSRAVGKLISGDVWYYVTVVPADQTAGVITGQRIPVTFANQFYETLQMKVERIGEEEDGQRVLVLSYDRYMQYATLLRQQSADVVFTSYSGLRVPKEAIRVQEQQAGVYVVESNAAVWKRVNILHDNGESYVVELDKSSTHNLWPGDEIIVGARNLYDGKVVR